MSTLMIPSQPYLTVMLAFPDQPRPLPRNIQRRTIEMYRNKGFCLIHRPRQGESSSRHTVSTTSGNFQLPVEQDGSLAGIASPNLMKPFVAESFSDLVQYHRDGLVYELVLRPTYNIPTFAAALTVVCSPGVAEFSSLSDFCDTRKYRFVLNQAQRKDLPNKWTLQSPLGRQGTISQRFDCLLLSKAASAIVAAVPQHCGPEAASHFLMDFHDSCLYTHFLAERHADLRLRALWTEFFNSKSFMYAAVPEGAVSDASRVVSGACAADGHVLCPPQLVQREPVLRTAQKLGVGLALRAGDHYHLLRLLLPR